MIRDLSVLNREEFSIKNIEFLLSSGERETLFLVEPIKNAPVVWTKDNLIFRSSMWNAKGELVSAGFPKFFNWDERSELFSEPTDITQCNVLEKLDGSLLIVSRYKETFIFRTRAGLVTSRGHKNWQELEKFKERLIPTISQILPLSENWDFSLLFEWVSPINQIVIHYYEPDFYLIGNVYHQDYRLAEQITLNNLAVKGLFKRPKYYHYDNIESLKDAIKALKGEEGVVVYSQNDQVLHKCKSDWYRNIHHLKTEVASEKKMLDLWFNLGKPPKDHFQSYIENTYDFEILEYWQSFIQRLYKVHADILSIAAQLRILFGIHNVFELPRAQQAEWIRNNIIKSRQSLAFRMLLHDTIEDKQLRNLIEQIYEETYQ